jgi:hypothetical protein
VNRVQNVQAVQPLRSVQFVLPRDAGEDERGDFNDLNDLNYLNEPK